MLSNLRRKAILLSETSRRNKIALITQYQADGEYVTWCWHGHPYESRLLVIIDDGPVLTCKSYDEDIRPTLRDK